MEEVCYFGISDPHFLAHHIGGRTILRGLEVLLMLRLTVFTLSAVVFLTAQLRATQEGSASLSPKILQAKTVFVDNQSGYVRARNEFYDAVGKWNHLRIVADKANADLVAILTVQKTERTTRLAVVDPKTGDVIWTNAMAWSEQGAARDLVVDLRKRIDEQEKTH
jgi:hypothetical protein